MAEPTIPDGLVPCDGSKITLGGRMQGKHHVSNINLPQRPGVYTNVRTAPVGTITSWNGATGYGATAVPEKEVIMTPKGWAALRVSNAPVTSFATQGLVDMMEEIESLFEIAEQMGPLPYCSLDEKAKEYNRYEEELIKRLEENPPLTVGEGSMYDVMMKPILEEKNNLYKYLYGQMSSVDYIKKHRGSWPDA